MAQGGMKRIVMRYCRHARQQIFQTTNQQTVCQRYRARRHNVRVRVETRIGFERPFARIGIAGTLFPTRKVVELQMVMGVDQPGQNERAVQIKTYVAALRGGVNACDAPVGDAQGAARFAVERVNEARIFEIEGGSVAEPIHVKINGYAPQNACGASPNGQ